jgi:tetratricopeptide (TPR) repeat protein
MGFEGGRALSTRGGVVRALHRYDGGQVVESTTPFTSGASGGALFDDEGQLVGILTYRLRGDQRSYFSVPVEWVASRLIGASYVPIAPLEGSIPFWQRARDRLPYFLRAHQLELGRDWDGLRSLADEWCKAESTNAEAWLFRGKSLAQNQDVDAARQSFRQAVALDPVSASAWLALGRLSIQHGPSTDAADALTQLNRLNSGLADCLVFAMEPNDRPTPGLKLDIDDCSQI